MSTAERLPPHNRTAERELLGMIFRNPTLLAEVFARVSVDHFYVVAHALIFKAMIALQDAGTPIDHVTVATWLTEAGHLDDIGGPSYLVDIWSDAPSAGTHLFHADTIRNEARKRNLIHLANKIGDRANSPREPVAAVIADLEAGFLEVVEDVAAGDVKHIAETTAETWAALDERRARRGPFSGIPSGFADLDEITAGFKAGELVIIAARPSVGKTAIAVNVARHVAVAEKVPTLFVSLEQSRVELTERLLCCQGMIDAHRLKTGRLRDDEGQRTFAAGDALIRTDLYIDDAPGQSLTQICANARRMKRMHGIGLIIIDYLQLILPGDRTSNRQEQVAAISRRLKLLARELKIPVIVLAQLNREAEKRGDGRPKLSDLRESGARMALA